MTALDYLKKKNELVRRVTGKTLIPEYQLVEHELTKEELAGFRPNFGLSVDNCTYCIMYIVGRNSCKNCPMYRAGNHCAEEKSTYEKARGKWEQKSTQYDKEALYELGREFLRRAR